MSYSVPDGSKLSIATTMAAAIAVSAVTNANPAVASSTAHGLLDGAVFIFSSGWEDATNRVFRVDNKTTDAFDIEGLNSTSTTRFPAGSGVGTVTPITAWTEIQQVLNPTSSGGEQQFATVEPLALLNNFQIPTGVSAQTISIPIGDDPTLAGYQAILAAAEARSARALRVQKPNGEVMYFYGYFGLNPTPTLTKGQVMTVTASFSPFGPPTRFAS